MKAIISIMPQIVTAIISKRLSLFNNKREQKNKQQQEEEEDPELYQDLLKELGAVEEGLEDLEVKKMLSGELDNKNCYLSVNAGAGGTESCDWASMLLRMYQKWAAKRGWKVEDKALRSKSKNTPFDGRPVQGQVRQTVIDGRLVFEAAD